MKLVRSFSVILYIYIVIKNHKWQREMHLTASEDFPYPILSAGNYEFDKFQNPEFVNHLNKSQLPKETS